MKVAIKSITAPNIVEYIAEFARVSRNRDTKESTAEQDLNRCKQLWRDGHHTAFECINIDFLIEEVSRSLLAQITRYRIATFMVESQRYVKYSDEIDFVVPDEISEKSSVYIDICNGEFNAKSVLRHSEEMYEALTKSGAKPEDARCVLPNATPTRFRVVMNLRSFFNFYKQRAVGPHAQAEIRELAELMFLSLANMISDKSWQAVDLLEFIRDSFSYTLSDLIKNIKQARENENCNENFAEDIEKILKEYSDFA